MQNTKQSPLRMRPVRAWTKLAALLAAVVTLAVAVQATPDDHAKQGPSLDAQIAELRAKVARLEAALLKEHQGGDHDKHRRHKTKTDPSKSDSTMKSRGMGMRGMKMSGDAGMGKGMGKGMGMGMGMGMRGMKMSGDAGMGMGAMAGMTKMKMGMGRMKRMRMMGKMNRDGEQPRLAMMSSLPGFPGSSHIYHIGASEHFLDHADVIAMTPDQRRRIAKIHQDSRLRQNDHERAAEKAEQELWVLTSQGEPDAKAIAAKVRAIAMHRAEMRLAFIKSVGHAAEVLTPAQRAKLIGEHAPSSEGSRKR